MDPFLYSLIALIALALGVTVGYLIGRNSTSGGGPRSPLEWPHVVIDPRAKHPTAAEMLEAIYEEARTNGPPDPDLRDRVMRLAVWCQYGHYQDPWHIEPDWDDPLNGAKGKVDRAYKAVFDQPQADWQLCADELDHNP
jgi:hypothetical protein